ncbi:MAG TPA: hypothetical protein VFT99_06905, partial [Roseiflexaceae bacterium]|nr:hypothetical protein [Roseiflexaceae bacterium]
MLLSPAATAELLPLYRQFCAELTEARSFSDGVAICLRVLKRHLQANSIDIIWKRGAAWSVVSSGQALAVLPDERALRTLRTGDMVVRAGHVGRPTTCFVPLRARGELQGWFFFEQPALTADTELFLPLLGDHAGPVLSMLAAT